VLRLRDRSISVSGTAEESPEEAYKLYSSDIIMVIRLMEMRLFGPIARIGR
jgi:hypothetical protein